MKRSILVIAGLCLAQPAFAASAPPTTVMMGTVAATSAKGVGKYQCGTNPGPAMFQRAATSPTKPNPPAIIDFPAVFLGSLSVGSSFTGAVALQFTSAAAGTVRFDYDRETINTNLPAGKTAPFSKYKQVWTPSSGMLKVTFDIDFANCTLPIVALFRTVS
jgi:hypothetical protein